MSALLSTPPPPATAGRPVLRLLGGFDLVHDGEPVRVVPTAQRLLAHLALRARRTPADRRAVADALWPGAAPSRASANLRSALWRTPRPGGHDLVAATATTLSLADEVVVDLDQGQRRARDLAAGRAAGAPPAAVVAELLEGLGEDLLPDWSDDWLLDEREAHRQSRLHALERLAASLRAAGQHAQALDAALAAVRCEPLRESAHREVIEVHLAEGNSAEALRQYQALRRLLADELGIPPSPVARSLVQHLLARPLDGR